jgi:LysR family transcriptional regulator (chromosome initiation inhibitor)
MLKHYLRVKRLEDDLLGEVEDKAGRDFTSLAVGINADSLATWFLDAIRRFLVEEKVLLDIRVDDQEQTHRLLRDGEVVGCISTQERPMQGCRMAYLGRMRYRLLATPGFAAGWFPRGLTIEEAGKAPILIFNRKDELHQKLFLQALGEAPDPLPTLYVPSSEKFADIIASGLAYGMLPDQQSRTLIEEGRLIDLAPDCHVPVKLYWHCWNLKSNLLEELTRDLIEQSDHHLDR